MTRRVPAGEPVQDVCRREDLQLQADGNRKRAFSALQFGFGHRLARRVFGLCLPASLVSPGSIREAGELDAADWHRLCQMAGTLGVRPLFEHSLERAGLLGAVPSGERRALAEARTAQEQHNSQVLSSLGQLFQHATREGWRLALMKEASLLGPVYPGLALRHLKDVDLLTEAGELNRIETFALEELRYTECDLASQMPARRRFWPLPLAHASEMLERVEPANVAGVQVWSLAPEDNLIWLCWHDFDHGWRFLPRLLDVIWFVEAHGPRLSWQELLARARSWGVEAALYPTMAVARSAGDAPVPEHVIRRLREATGASWVQQLMDLGMWFRSPYATRLTQWWRVAQWHTIRLSVAAHRPSARSVAGMSAAAFRKGSRVGDSLAYAVGHCEAGALSLWRRLAGHGSQDAPPNLVNHNGPIALPKPRERSAQRER